VFLGAYIARVTVGLNEFLSGLTGASAIALGVILGLMMCFDLGGPVNKVAYSFAVAGLGAASITNQAPWQIMAAVMAAGMVPPLAMALAATVLNKRLFSLAEQENGKAAWLLGASFITEGAIPFDSLGPYAHDSSMAVRCRHPRRIKFSGSRHARPANSVAKLESGRNRVVPVLSAL